MRIALICVLFLSQFAKAQKISDAYLIEREKYWTVDFKAVHESLGMEKDSIYYFLPKRALKDVSILKNIFVQYQNIKKQNLDKAKSIYFLEKSTFFDTEYIIWNSTDTIYIKYASLSLYKNPEKIAIQSFHDQKVNKEIPYLIAVMDMVSKVKEDQIQTSIANRTQTSKYVLDGSSFTLYFFNKINKNYQVKKFSFENPEFIN